MFVNVPLSLVHTLHPRPYIAGCFSDSDDSPFFEITFKLTVEAVYDKVGYVYGVLVVPVGVYTGVEVDRIDVAVLFFFYIICLVVYAYCNLVVV